MVGTTVTTDWGASAQTVGASQLQAEHPKKPRELLWVPRVGRYLLWGDLKNMARVLQVVDTGVAMGLQGFQIKGPY